MVFSIKHGMIHTSEYRAWTAMRNRCTNKNHKFYPDYGGRGIKVCLEWDDFMTFYNHIGPKSTKLHTLNRIRNNEGYVPGNVEWSTQRDQMNNTRYNVIIDYLGYPITLMQAVEVAGNVVKYATANRRIKFGWPAKAAVETPAIAGQRRPTERLW